MKRIFLAIFMLIFFSPNIAFSFMDTETGRFITTDPVEGNIYDPRTLNQYSYAFNNPLKFVDPWGLEVTYEGPHKILLEEIVNYLKKSSPTINQTILYYSGLGEDDPDLIFNTTDYVHIDVKGEIKRVPMKPSEIKPGVQIVEGWHHPVLFAPPMVNEAGTGLTETVNCELVTIKYVEIFVPTHVFIATKTKKDKLAGVLIHEIGHADHLYNNKCYWGQNSLDRRNLKLEEAVHSERDIEIVNIPYIKRAYNEVKVFNKKAKEENKKLKRANRMEIIKPTLELPTKSSIVIEESKNPNVRTIR